MLRERLAKIKEIVENGGVVTSQERRGVKGPPIMVTYILIKRCLAPILHSVDFMGNLIMDRLEHYLLTRVEKVPDEVLELRMEVADAAIQKAEFEELYLDGKSEVAMWQGKVDKISEQPITQERGSKAARQKELKPIKDELKAAKEEIKVMFDQYKESKEELTSLSTKLKKALDSIGALDKDLLQRIKDRFEKELGVVDSSYHGGDMEGRSCRRLAEFDIAEKAMAIVREESKRITTADADDLEIDQYTGAFARLLQLTGMMISLCYAPYGTLIDDDMIRAEKIVQKFNEQWRAVFENVPPKVHMWDHLLEDLEFTRGMLYHQEGFIELMHQEGKRMRRRFGGVRGGILKILDSQCQAMVEKHAQEEQIRQVNKKSNRNFKNKEKAEIEEAARKGSNKRRAAEILQQPTITGFKSYLELNIESRQLQKMWEMGDESERGDDEETAIVEDSAVI